MAKAQRHGSMIKWASATCPMGLNETTCVKDVAGWDASAPPAVAATGTLVCLRGLWNWILQGGVPECEQEGGGVEGSSEVGRARSPSFHGPNYEAMTFHVPGQKSFPVRHTFPVKDLLVNMSGFAGHVGSVAILSSAAAA